MKQLLKFFNALIYRVHESNKLLRATEKLFLKFCFLGFYFWLRDSIYVYGVHYRVIVFVVIFDYIWRITNLVIVGVGSGVGIIVVAFFVVCLIHKVYMKYCDTV